MLMELEETEIMINIILLLILLVVVFSPVIVLIATLSDKLLAKIYKNWKRG